MKTLVIYQYPQARQDVQDWADKMNFTVNPEDKEFVVGRDKESIYVIPSEAIFSLEEYLFNKLVLFGAFDHYELRNILVRTKEI